MLTERAKLIIIILVITTFIAWYTQFELIYFIAALLASILLISFLIFKLTLINTICSRQLPNTAFEDQILKVKIVLENQSGFANYFVYLKDNFPADVSYKQEKKIILPQLARRATITWTYEGLCFKRGVYWIGPLVLIGSDPLGLFKKYKIINIFSKLTVYPKIFDIKGIPSFSKGMITPRYGSRTSRLSGDYEEFYGIREYHQEDGLRKIHWPLTAKHNQLMVRHFEQSRIHAITIALDLNWENNLGFGKETTLEYAVKIAGSLSKYYLDQGYIVQLLAYGDKPIISSFGRDPLHFLTILELLAQMESNSSYPLGKALIELTYFIPPTSTLAVVRLDKDIQTAKSLEQFIYTKNVSILDVQLISSTFDKNISKCPSYFLEARGSDILTYHISCQEELEASFTA